MTPEQAIGRFDDAIRACHITPRHVFIGSGLREALQAAGRVKYLCQYPDTSDLNYWLLDGMIKAYERDIPTRGGTGPIDDFGFMLPKECR